MGIHIPADGGRPIGRDGGGVIKIAGDQTSDRFGVVEQTLDAGRIIPPHRHDHDVWLQVLRGEVGVRVEDETVVGAVGSWVLKPRDLVHAMWNAGSAPARVMEVFTPAGFEGFMRRVTESEQKGELDDATFRGLCEAHGIEFYDDWPGDPGWVRRISDRYNLDVD